MSEEETLAAAEVEESAAVENEPDYQAQAAEYKDRYLRTLAEMDNLRKRFDRERREVAKYSVEGLLKDVLRVYDVIEKSIQMARQHHPDDASFVEGLVMTERMLLDILKQNHVIPIETQDASFDPNFHEALMQMPKEGAVSGQILDVLERGFMLHERVLRPAKVTVAI